MVGEKGEALNVLQRHCESFDARDFQVDFARNDSLSQGVTPTGLNKVHQERRRNNDGEKHADDNEEVQPGSEGTGGRADNKLGPYASIVLFFGLEACRNVISKRHFGQVARIETEVLHHDLAGHTRDSIYRVATLSPPFKLLRNVPHLRLSRGRGLG